MPKWEGVAEEEKVLPRDPEEREDLAKVEKSVNSLFFKKLFYVAILYNKNG